MNESPASRKIVVLASLFIFLVVAINVLRVVKSNLVSKTNLASQPKEEAQNSGTTPEELVLIDKNKNFSITLESNPTTGYSWEVIIDESYIKLLNSTYAPNSDSKKLGSGGNQSFEFKPVKSGDTKMTFEYRRPWEKNTPPEKIEIYKVSIR